MPTQTENTNIPEGWIETTLGEVCEIKYGKDHKELQNGNIPCFGSGGFMRNVDSFLYNKPSVLIPRKGTISNLFFVETPFWTVDTLFYTKIDENKILAKFLFYKLKNEKLEDLNVGSAVPSLTTDVLNQFTLSLPPLPEQQAIASILSSFDDKIELLRKQNETLEKIGQEIFKEWFGKYGVEDELPEGWRIYEFKNIVKQIKPGTNYQPDRVENGIPFVNGRNVKNGFLDLSDVKYITKEEYERVHNSWIPEENDILITRIGTLGNVGVINKEELPLAVHYNNIDIKSSITSYQFIYFLLKSEYFLYFYHLRKKQAVQEYITIEDVESIPLILPKNILELNKMEIIFINLFDKIRGNYNQIQNLSKTRDELLPRLMRGGG